jgi:hypothetical protein
MRELANHLPTGAVLNQECVFPVDTLTASDVGHFDEQCLRTADGQRRYATLHGARAALSFVGRERCLADIGDAAGQRVFQDLGEGAIVVDNLEKRLAVCSQSRNAKQVFCRRIDFPDQQVTVKKDDGRALAIENVAVGRAGAVVRV